MLLLLLLLFFVVSHGDGPNGEGSKNSSRVHYARTEQLGCFGGSRCDAPRMIELLDDLHMHVGLDPVCVCLGVFFWFHVYLDRVHV
jgi:hypothetical protein